MAEVTVTFKGPLFDGTADMILTTGMEQTRRQIAEETLTDLKQSTQVFRNPTGTYESRLHTEHAGFTSKVLPGDLPYIWWVETGKRRGEQTRFPGYYLFKQARLRLEATVQARFEAGMRPWIDKIR